MKTSSITVEDIKRSVWAVPPLALLDDGTLNEEANRALIGHIERGGVSTILYGGNANLYSAPSSLYRALMEAAPDWVGQETWLIPSVGPDWGRLVDQAPIIRDAGCPAAMALPMSGPSTPEGIERGYRDFVEISGVPLIIYLRSASLISVDRLAALIEDGVALAVKYAVETGDFGVDPFLTELLKHAPSERIVSGIGEIAAVRHLEVFGLAGFTAGAVCIAPKRSMAILKALQSGAIEEARTLCDAIQPLEDLRNRHGPIPVIHEAVTRSGIADMGIIQPQLSPLSTIVGAEVGTVVSGLLGSEANL